MAPWLGVQTYTLLEVCRHEKESFQLWGGSAMSFPLLQSFELWFKMLVLMFYFSVISFVKITI